MKSRQVAILPTPEMQVCWPGTRSPSAFDRKFYNTYTIYFFCNSHINSLAFKVVKPQKLDLRQK